jgi:hypothetical protein
VKGRPSQLSDRARQRLEREATIVAQHTPYKILAAELGLTEQYVRNFICITLKKRIEINRTNASSPKD